MRECGAAKLTTGAASSAGLGGARKSLAPRASIDIGMALPEAMAHAIGDFEEFRRFANVERAPARETAIDHVMDAAGPRRHDDDARRKEYRLGNGMGDEEHG